MGGDVNLYSYVANSPSNFSDPSGLVLGPGFVPEYCRDPTAIPLTPELSGRKGAIAQVIAAEVAFLRLVARVVDCATMFGAPAPGVVSSGVRITEQSLAHIAARHTVGGAESAGASVFRAGEDVPKLVRQAEWMVPSKQAKGSNFERVVDTGRVVGTDRATGELTSWYTVITDAMDTLVTAFPGFPPF